LTGFPHRKAVSCFFTLNTLNLFKMQKGRKATPSEETDATSVIWSSSNLNCRFRCVWIARKYVTNDSIIAINQIKIVFYCQAHTTASPFRQGHLMLGKVHCKQYYTHPTCFGS